MKNDSMTTPMVPPKILLIESDAVGADAICATLAAAGSGSFDVEWVRRLSEGLERLSKRGIAAVLLALSLPIVRVLGRSTRCSAPRPTFRY